MVCCFWGIVQHQRSCWGSLVNQLSGNCMNIRKNLVNLEVPHHEWFAQQMCCFESKELNAARGNVFWYSTTHVIAFLFCIVSHLFTFLLHHESFRARWLEKSCGRETKHFDRETTDSIGPDRDNHQLVSEFFGKHNRHMQKPWSPQENQVMQRGVNPASQATVWDPFDASA